MMYYQLLTTALLLGSAFTLPINSRHINRSPTLDPKINLSDPLLCVGFAVCNSVAVDQTASKTLPQPSAAPQQQQQEEEEASQQKGASGEDDSLVNVAPAISPSVGVSDLVKCVGVAGCTPVTVNQGG
ncbi:hypothetical protein C8035_v004349 [Colletotrichum spinosum]|uniref:Hydrophobin n=1 Tax=Colletotrichum spinosum TaxID=1347390 RepID=A0A4V3HQ70_9PEZI|nr:hypothetical protein C8035_v004349 [Colletotrichum spinosum]